MKVYELMSLLGEYRAGANVCVEDEGEFINIIVRADVVKQTERDGDGSQDYPKDIRVRQMW